MPFYCFRKFLTFYCEFYSDVNLRFVSFSPFISSNLKLNRELTVMLFTLCNAWNHGSCMQHHASKCRFPIKTICYVESKGAIEGIDT